MVDQMAEVDGKGAFIVEVEGKAEDEVAECRAYLAKCPADDPDVLVDGACCDLKDGRHEAARAGFESARDAGGSETTTVTFCPNMVPQCAQGWSPVHP